MSVLIIHPGTQYAKHLARHLYENGCLARFWTGLGIPDNGFRRSFLKILPTKLKSSLSNRIVEGVPGGHIRTRPLMELRALLALRGKNGSEAIFHERNRRFQLAIPDSEIERSEVVVGYDTSSWIIAERAKAMGKRFILDQSIGHPLAKEDIYTKLRYRYPSWTNNVLPKSSDCLSAERIEHELADIVVCPSEFVRHTLVEHGVKPKKILIIPFGTDLKLFKPGPIRSANVQQPVIFLFVGILNARKGLPVLLNAWSKAKPPNAELWLVGGGVIPREVLTTLPKTVKRFGRRPKAEVAELMRQADVFVFPSFFEGLAQVQVEALASGLPVIGTFESGATMIIKEGESGNIVVAGDEETLADRISRLSKDDNLVKSMKAKICAKRDQLGWNIYGSEWSKILSEA